MPENNSQQICALSCSFMALWQPRHSLPDYGALQRVMTPSTSLPSHGSLPVPNSELRKQRSVPHPAGMGHPYGSSPDSIEPSVQSLPLNSVLLDVAICGL